MAKTNKGRKLFATTATAALVASAIVPVASAAQVNDYNSIASYAQEAVQDLVDRGVVQGDANGNFQPRKSVSRAEAATILSGALGLTTTDAIYFKDVKSGAWYYDAINAAVNNRVFSGKGDGIFDPNGNLTRGEAAVILVSAFNLTGKAPLAQFADEKSVKEWAKESLEIAVGNGVVKGDNGRIKANDAITKQDFAVMFARAEAAAGEVAAPSTVKAINNTTVEVTFADADFVLSELNFAIEGLTVSNKVVKQTDPKTVVLTTSAQTAGTTYAVTVNGNEVGKFTGVAEVVPTKVEVTTKSVQGTISKDVTLKATVTVPEGQSKANIPVTFNITGSDANAAAKNPKIEAVVLTNAEGVAEYTYTRYYEHNDEFVAYATSKSSVADHGVVYWAEKLAVKEVTTGNELANNGKKVYEVNGEKNTVYYVTFEENIGVTSEKIVDAEVLDAHFTSSSDRIPYQLTNGASQILAVKTDNSGKATFAVSGADVKVTPIVFKDSRYTTTFDSGVTFQATELFAKAPTVTFSDVLYHDLTVTPVTTESNASFYNDYAGAGGRDYKVKVTTKDGKAVPTGTSVYVYLDQALSSADAYLLGTNGYVYTETNGTRSNEIMEVKVDSNGEAVFTVFGRSATAYGTPVVFLDRVKGTATTTGVVNTGDIKVTSEITRFVAPTVESIALKFYDSLGKEVTNTTASAKARVQILDKQGKVKVNETSSTYQVRLDITNPSLSNLTIVNGGVSTTLNNGSNTYFVNVVNGIAEVELSTAAVLTASVSASYNGKTTSGSVSFNSTSVLPSAYTGAVSAINLARETVKIGNFDAVGYNDANTNYTYIVKARSIDGTNPTIDQTVNLSTFEGLLSRANALTLTRTVVGNNVTFVIENAVSNSFEPVGTLGSLATNAGVTVQSKLTDAINAAILAGRTNLTFNAGTTSENLSINVPAGTTLNVTLTGNISGNVTVDTPDSDFTNRATITGTVTVTDVDNNTFYNYGSIKDLVVADKTGARIYNAGTISTLEIAPQNNGASQQLALEGNFANTNVLVTKDANVTFNAGTTATVKVATGVTLVADNKAGSGVTTTGGTVKTPAEANSEAELKTLKAAIDDTKAIKNDDKTYTVESFKALTDAIEAGEKVVDGTDIKTTKAAATKAITDAKAKLVKATYTLTVTVTGNTDAVVEVTDAAGKKVTDLTKVTNGKYTVKVTKEGFQEFTKEVTVAGSNVTETVVLEAVELEEAVIPTVESAEYANKELTITFSSNVQVDAGEITIDGKKGTIAKVDGAKTVKVTFTEDPTTTGGATITVKTAATATHKAGSTEFTVKFTAAAGDDVAKWEVTKTVTPQ